MPKKEDQFMCELAKEKKREVAYVPNDKAYVIDGKRPLPRGAKKD